MFLQAFWHEGHITAMVMAAKVTSIDWIPTLRVHHVIMLITNALSRMGLGYSWELVVLGVVRSRRSLSQFLRPQISGITCVSADKILSFIYLKQSCSQATASPQ